MCAFAIAAGLLAWYLAGFWLLLFAATLFGVSLGAASDWLSGQTGMPRWTAMLLCVILGAAILVAFFWFAAASLVSQLADLSDRIPRALESLRSWASGYSFLRPISREVAALLQGESGRASPELRRYLGRAIDASRFTLGTIGNILVMVVLTVYLAIDVRRYADGVLRLVPPGWRDSAAELLEAWGRALPWWLAARLAAMAIVALLTSIGLAIAGVPLPLVLGLIAGVLSFVPFLGPIASVIPAALVALTDSTGALVGVFVVFAVVQALESYLITPQLQRRTVSVPPFPLVAAQVAAGTLLGIPGVIFATPLLLTLALAIQVLWQKRILGEDSGMWGIQ